MKWVVSKVVSKVMGSFVAEGVSIDEDGRLCLPDGLTPERVKLFIELCLDRSFASPKEAMHSLFGNVGVSAEIIRLLNLIIHDNGDVDMSACAHHWRELTKALGRFQEIPNHFKEFLINDLSLADPASRTLEEAVVSTRKAAADRFGCPAGWDEILGRPQQVSELASPWRAGLA